MCPLSARHLAHCLSLLSVRRPYWQYRAPGLPNSNEWLFHELPRAGGSPLFFLRHLCGPLFDEPKFCDTSACAEHDGSQPLKCPYAASSYCRDPKLSPNVQLRYVTVNGKLTCAVVASRRITSATELRLDWQQFATDYRAWLESPMCRCGSPYCRGRLLSPSPDRCWWWMYRFGPVPPSHEKDKPAALTHTAAAKPAVEPGFPGELATCVSFPGLPRPLHAGDFVLLPPPDGGGNLARPAQVLFFDKKANHSPCITYRLCTFDADTYNVKCWEVDPRGIRLTADVLLLNMTVKKLFPVAILNLVRDGQLPDVRRANFRFAGVLTYIMPKESAQLTRRGVRRLAH